MEGEGLTVFRVIGFDGQIAQLETLMPGDSVAVQGRLEIESKDGKLSGLFVIAEQVLTLRKQSISRLSVRASAAQ